MLEYRVPGPPEVQHPLRAANLRRVLRGPSYRPPPLPQAPRLGQSVASPGFAGSLMFIAGGVGSFYVSEIFGSPFAGVVKGLGIIAVGWGAYNLMTAFSGTSKIDTKAKADAQAAKAMSVAAFDKISGSIVWPLAGSRPELTTDGFFGPPGFNVQVIWRNDSGEDATFPYDIVAYAAAAPGIPVEGKTWTKQIAYNSSVTLGRGEQSPRLEIFIPTIQPPQRGNEAFGPSVFYMDLQLRKISASGDAVPMGNLVRFGPFDFK